MKSIKTYIPNTITCLNLLCGSLAIVLAFHDGMTFGPLVARQWAWVLIGAAAVFDFCDGLSAARSEHIRLWARSSTRSATLSASDSLPLFW